jgi:hypothetical protein
MKLALALLLFACMARAQGSAPEIKIPPAKFTVQIDQQRIELTAWGTVSPSTGADALNLTVDLGGLQEHLTQALAGQLNRSEKCGERLTVESATLAPAAPSGALTANVNYERYACAKAFGREIVKKLVSGHGVVELKLTPQVADNNISVEAEVRKMDADGSLGELLRSGSFGDSLRQDIGDSIESAIQKSADLKAFLPAAIQNAVTIQSVRFADGGSGRLWLNIAGQVRLPAAELRRALGQ